MQILSIQLPTMVILISEINEETVALILNKIPSPPPPPLPPPLPPPSVGVGLLLFAEAGGFPEAAAVPVPKY
jgi:hypothetical protein